MSQNNVTFEVFVAVPLLFSCFSNINNFAKGLNRMNATSWRRILLRSQLLPHSLTTEKNPSLKNSIPFTSFTESFEPPLPQCGPSALTHAAAGLDLALGDEGRLNHSRSYNQPIDPWTEELLVAFVQSGLFDFDKTMMYGG